ncbi:unnamed protein product [Trifolium pratense]|uniref:Uncharacterized protein n=1 Tax=Trifolium pratense TaxID=57577 RepID=A0ACB0IDV1_TRIPR|nr:unnamed protein product [Trifolium pratense]
MMDAPEENKNLPFSNKQEEDDYWFHEYIVSLLSVEEAVPIDELLGKQEPGVGYVQDGYMKDSVDVGTKPELPSCTSSLHEKNAASYQKSLLPSCYTSDSQRCVLPRNDSYVIALPALNRSSATKTESSSSTSSWLLSASEGNCISQVPASTERYLGPPEIEVQATKDFTQSSVHVARSSARYPESPNSTSSLLLSASQRHCLLPVPASAERYFGPSEIEVQATKDFNRSSAHIARSSARHPESPSNTSFLLPASQGSLLSSLIPTPTERHLRPSEIEVHATNDFTQSPFHNVRPSPRKLESPSSTSSFLLPASQGNRLSSLIPASTERHLRPSEIDIHTTNDFTQSPFHNARPSPRKLESPSSTSSFLLPASQGHRLSLIPALTERHLGPPEIEVQATKDFTQSSVHVARSSARYPESPNSTSSLLLSASQRHCLLQVPASAERYFGPSEIEVQATKDFNRSSAHIARSSARHPESPSNTSFLLPASQGNHLSSLIPTPTERHLRPSEIEVHATNDFTQSPFHNVRPSPRKLESPSSTSSFLLPASQGHRLSLIPALTERHLGPSEIEVQATKDFTQPSVHIAGEDFGQSIPQRKRKM